MAESDNDARKEEICKHEGWEDIKDKKRGCTDILLLLMLIASWVAMTGVGLVVTGFVKDKNLPTGNPRRLINSIDYDGRICGYDEAVKDKPLGYYMLDKSVVCVKECPKVSDINMYICHDGSIGSYNTVASNECMYYVESKNMLNRCISSADVALLATTAQASANSNTKLPAYGSDTSDDWFSQTLGDLYDNSAVIFGVGLGAANAVAFLYLYILRIPGVLFMAIWGILLTVLIALLAGGFLILEKSKAWKGDGVHTDTDVQMMEIAAYVTLGFGGLFACLLLVMRKRIQLALNIIKEAARALAAMPMLILMPVIQALALCVFLFPWIIYCLYLASSGELQVLSGTYPTPGGGGAMTEYTYKDFTYTTNTKYAFLYMLFCWFWTSQFIVALGQLSIALALVSWYFTHKKENVGNHNVLWAGKTALRYHAGTAAFGSLVIALIKTIRAVLLYVQKKAAKSNNKVLVAVLACIQCCMWCVEKCMKFLNKNAYIQTAIYGTSFCASCVKAFFLIARNIMRVIAVNMVADFILMLGRLFIPVVTTLCAYLALAYKTGSTNGLVLPLIFVFILSYFIGCMYSEIFGMSIETILCCFIADEEMFPAEGGLRFAEKGLATTMANTQAEHAKSNPQVGVAPSNVNPEKGGVVAVPLEEEIL